MLISDLQNDSSNAQPCGRGARPSIGCWVLHCMSYSIQVIPKVVWATFCTWLHRVLYRGFIYCARLQGLHVIMKVAAVSVMAPESLFSGGQCSLTHPGCQDMCLLLPVLHTFVIECSAQKHWCMAQCNVPLVVAWRCGLTHSGFAEHPGLL